MSKGITGFGPSPITPSTHRKGNFAWWIIKLPFVLLGSILVSTATAWYVVMADIYGIDRIPSLLESLYEKQSAVVVILPIVLTVLYFIININRKTNGSS